MARISVVKRDAGFGAQGTSGHSWARDLPEREGESLGCEQGWGPTCSPVPCLGCGYQCGWRSSFPSIPIPQHHPLPAHPGSLAVNRSW